MMEPNTRFQVTGYRMQVAGYRIPALETSNP